MKLAVGSEWRQMITWQSVHEPGILLWFQNIASQNSLSRKFTQLT